MHKGYLAGALALAFLTTVPGLARAEADPLSQDEAVRIAMEGGDPAARRFEARAEAEEARAVADAQLPDPKLNARAANVPVDSFDFDQDNMTQLRFGARQAFPPGATLRLRGEQRRDAARVERARHDLVLRKIARDVRLAWLDLYHWRETADLVRESSDAVEEMIVSLRAGFATGGLTRQDVLRAELEVSLLDDRLVELTRRTETARVDLARYVGAAANRPLPGEGLQNEPIPPLGEMEAVLPRHPVVRVEDAEIAVAETEMDLADEAYKPAFGLEGGYGIRQGGRADLASIGVTLSVPLFTGRRQDQQRGVAAPGPEGAGHRVDRQLAGRKRRAQPAAR